MRRGAEDGGRRRGAVARWGWLGLSLLGLLAGPLRAQDDAPRRLDSGRFTAVFFPRDELLASSMLKSAVRNDSFPWLPRPSQRVLIAIAPDAARFRAWVGPDAPEWGAAIAFPESRRIVMQGRVAGSDAGNPIEVLRHELAHLALHERLGNKPPRWFDEGYASVAAREWRRDDALAANVALAVTRAPGLDQLEEGFHAGSLTAQSSYALSYRAVTELAALDTARGLTLFFKYWEEGHTLDASMREAFGLTLSGFERLFQERTRRRYGGLALFADFSLAMVVLGLMMLPFMIARRLRDRRRLEAMLIADEKAEQAERESAIAALIGDAGASSGDEDGRRPE